MDLLSLLHRGTGKQANAPLELGPTGVHHTRAPYGCASHTHAPTGVHHTRASLHSVEHERKYQLVVLTYSRGEWRGVVRTVRKANWEAEETSVTTRGQPAPSSGLVLNSHMYLSNALGEQSQQSHDHMGSQGVEKVVKTEVRWPEASWLPSHRPATTCSQLSPLHPAEGNTEAGPASKLTSL